MELTNRDYEILRLVCKFKFCLGKHIRVLAGFDGLRVAERRIKALIEAGYLSRKKYMYGVSYLYTLPHKGRILLGVNKREDKIRVDRITHDIYVLDTVIYCMARNSVSLSEIESEKELHIKDGFGTRKHHPDFVVDMDGYLIAFEVELNPKTKTRMEQNIRDNYLNYNSQVWVTNDKKVLALLEGFKEEYSNIEVLRLETVIDYAQHGYS